MRKASAGVDPPPPGVVSTLRSASGLGRRTPAKKNSRKRIILQEKMSRELCASRSRVSEGQVRCPACARATSMLFTDQHRILMTYDMQANVQRCVSLAASLQVRTVASGVLCFLRLLFCSGGRFRACSAVQLMRPCCCQHTCGHVFML